MYPDSFTSFQYAFMDFFDPYLGVVKVVSLLVTGFLIFGIFYVLIKSNKLGKEVGYLTEVWNAGAFSKKRTIRAWKQIEQRLHEGGESNLKLAIIEADKILDNILKLSGYRGETVADRLKQVTKAQISNVENLWQAHKLRNRIVHEPDFHMSGREADLAIKTYKATFEELGLIE